MPHSIVITGEGIVCAIGNNTAEVAHSLLHQRTGIGQMRHLHSALHNLPVGEVKLSNSEMEALLSLPHNSNTSRTALMGMMAVRQAVAQAQLCDKETQTEEERTRTRKEDGCANNKDTRAQDRKQLRVVLISGTTVAGMDITEQRFARMMQEEKTDSSLNQHDGGSNTEAIARHFDLFSDFTTLSTACSSAANAIILGADMLKAGDADIVVAGGTEALSQFHLNGFHSLMILDQHTCRPFDNTRAGLNLGEGAAYIVMEREADAVARGAKIAAYLSGYGNACDAFHQTASSPEGTGAQLAMREALKMAALQPHDIQWIEAHGTGTPNNDASESHAISQVFGHQMPPVSSTKGFTGHTTSAAGSISAVIALTAMHHRFIPANLGWGTPMDEGLVPTMGENDITLHHVMCNAFGFGGNDSSIILSDAPTACPNLTLMGENRIAVAAQVENTSTEKLKDIRRYISPMESRRMGKIMKSVLITSLEALEESGIAMPDAIITGTSWGSLESSERLLRQLAEGETLTSPTDFMQSTHNTMGSLVAIHLKCHGYNATFTQKERSLEWALYQARLLLRLGRCQTVLVGCHDESTPLFARLLQQLGQDTPPAVKSLAIVLKTTD